MRLEEPDIVAAAAAQHRQSQFQYAPPPSSMNLARPESSLKPTPTRKTSNGIDTKRAQAETAGASTIEQSRSGLCPAPTAKKLDPVSVAALSPFDLGTLARQCSANAGDAASEKHATSVEVAVKQANDVRMTSSLLDHTCVPCTVRQKRNVRHTTERPACFGSRCLRCASAGHRAANCPLKLISSTRKGGGCYQCSIGMIAGQVVHPVGVYGKKCCPIKKLMAMCIMAWEDKALRASIYAHAAETRRFFDTVDFTNWLRGSGNNSEFGLGCMVHWLDKTLHLAFP